MERTTFGSSKTCLVQPLFHIIIIIRIFLLLFLKILHISWIMGNSIISRSGHHQVIWSTVHDSSFLEYKRRRRRKQQWKAKRAHDFPRAPQEKKASNRKWHSGCPLKKPI